MIYFMQAIEGGPVKIGHSKDVDARRAQLEAHYRKPLALLGTRKGGRLEEREIHQRFAHLRFGKTEQFRPAADLMEFIGRPLLVGANPETVEAMKPEYASVMIDAKVARMAKKAATLLGKTLTAYLTEVIGEAVERDLALHFSSYPMR